MSSLGGKPLYSSSFSVSTRSPDSSCVTSEEFVGATAQRAVDESLQLVGREVPARSHEMLVDTDVTVVIATINERRNLPKLLQEIDNSIYPLPNIVVVDDGSTDGTREYLQELSRIRPGFQAILNDQKGTIARAHAQGFLASRTPYVAFMDADLQHPPELLVSMFARLRSGYDVAVGSRYLPGGSPGGRDPIRGVISRAACLIAKAVLVNGRRLSDPISGFFAIRKDMFPAAKDLQRGYETLFYVLCSSNKPKIVEVPYSFRLRASGSSKVVRGLGFVPTFLSALINAKRYESSHLRSRVAVFPLTGERNSD